MYRKLSFKIYISLDRCFILILSILIFEGTLRKSCYLWDMNHGISPHFKTELENMYRSDGFSKNHTRNVSHRRGIRMQVFWFCIWGYIYL